LEVRNNGVTQCRAKVGVLVSREIRKKMIYYHKNIYGIKMAQPIFSSPPTKIIPRFDPGFYPLKTIVKP
jgi:hypothetical protein